MLQVHNLTHKTAKNLKLLREGKNLSQEQLAAKLDIGVDGYRKWEAGYKQFDIENIILLALALELTPEAVFRGLCHGVI